MKFFSSRYQILCLDGASSAQYTPWSSMELILQWPQGPIEITVLYISFSVIRLNSTLHIVVSHSAISQFDRCYYTKVHVVSCTSIFYWNASMISVNKLASSWTLILWEYERLHKPW